MVFAFSRCLAPHPWIHLRYPPSAASFSQPTVMDGFDGRDDGRGTIVIDDGRFDGDRDYRGDGRDGGAFEGGPR